MPPAKEYLVTAIVSTYASERFIRGAMEDLVAQTIFPRTEVLVIDSASPEGEGEIVGEYARRYPENVFYHRTPRREPLYASWNRAIRMAKGKYLTSANADDRHSPDAFELLSGALEPSRTSSASASMRWAGRSRETHGRLLVWLQLCLSLLTAAIA